MIGAKDLLVDGDTDTTPFPSEFLSIDIANVAEKIGVEVDGPAHFVTVLDFDSDKNSFANGDVLYEGGGAKQMGNKMGWKFISNGRRKSNGATALKHRLLCHLGWCTVHIPFWEWRGLGGDRSSEDAYCKSLLEEVI